MQKEQSKNWIARVGALGLALAIGLSGVLSGVVLAHAVETTDTIAPAFDPSNIQPKYTITDSGDGRVRLTSNVTTGWETFKVGTMEFNEALITNTGTTKVLATVYDAGGTKVKTYDINVVIPEKQVSGIIKMDGAIVDLTQTKTITNKAVKIEVELTSIANPDNISIGIIAEKCKWTEKSKKNNGNKMIIEGEIIGDGGGKGKFGIDAREKVGGKEYKSNIVVSLQVKPPASSGDGGSSGGDSGSSGGNEPTGDMKLTLSTDKIEINAKEKGQIFASFTPKMKYSAWLDEGYSLKISTSDVKIRLDNFESKEDPYEAALALEAGEKASENYVTITLFKDGQELDSKLLKVKVKAETKDDNGSGSTGSGSGSSGGETVEKAEPTEKTLAGMEASTSLVSAIAALGPNEAVEYDSSNIFRLGSDGLKSLRGTSVRVCMSNKLLKSKLVIAAGDVKETVALGNVDCSIIQDEKMFESIESKLDNAKYDGNIDAYSFKFDPQQIDPTLELYTFIRDGRKAYLYNYDNLSRELTPIGDQVVWNSTITTRTIDALPVVILEKDINRLGESSEPTVATPSSDSNAGEEVNGEGSSSDEEMTSSEGNMNSEIVNMNDANNDSNKETDAKKDKKAKVLPIIVAVVMSVLTFAIILTILLRRRK